MSAAHQDRGDELEQVLTSFDTNYVWNYGDLRQGLADLYDKAKRDQWDGRELAWTTPVDPEDDIIPVQFNPLQDYAPFQKLSDKERRHFQHSQIAWQLAQFMHGEQGAMIVASQLVSCVPDLDAKYYASTQTMDEARHVEVFSRYLHQKLEWEWPINTHLKSLLDIIIKDGRWDVKYLGMQILVEGLAMGAFSNLHAVAEEPLLKDLLYNVMRDESRHVAFGVLSLKDFYDDMPQSELADRETFVIEACTLMRDRMLGEETADVMGFDREEVRLRSLNSPVMVMFRQQLFSRVVPNIKRLGLLTPRVRQAFVDLGIIQFEDVDPDAQDRALGLL